MDVVFIFFLYIYKYTIKTENFPGSPSSVCICSVNTRTQFSLSYIISHLCLSLCRHLAKAPQIARAVWQAVTKPRVWHIWTQRKVTGERRKNEGGKNPHSSGAGGVKEGCCIMYNVFVQVAVGSNAAMTHLKLALACPQRPTEAPRALANPYSPDTCSAWRIHGYWPSIQQAFRVDEKR